MKKEVLLKFIHFSIIPKDDRKQALRIRRFFMAFATSIFCASLAYVSYLAGFMEWKAIAGFLIFIPIFNITLYIFLRTGLNLKMADPSLTAIQISFAILLVMYGMYFANEARGVLLLIYGGDIALLQIYRPQGVNFHIEYLQLGVLALVLMAFSVIGGYISSLRQNLSISKSEQAKSIAIIREMAIRDELTGLFNRRHVLEFLDYEKNRSLRGGGIFCLAMLDIDHFKNVNDIYGHLVGDAVLQAVATTMKTTMRNTEYCARYGGEEFLIVLTQTGINGALIGAERVRTNIEKIPFPNIGSDFKITVSIGLSEYRMREGVDDIIARADEALYRAKNGGRNRVETA
jgi:diguanylate cyclase (GGDEF)-like protein